MSAILAVDGGTTGTRAGLYTTGRVLLSEVTADGRTPVAVLMARKGLEPQEAMRRIEDADGLLHEALKAE